jgi:hypothetical protein
VCEKKERNMMLCELGKEKEEVLGTHECHMYMMNIAKAAREQ